MEECREEIACIWNWTRLYQRLMTRPLLFCFVLMMQHHWHYQRKLHLQTLLLKTANCILWRRRLHLQTVLDYHYVQTDPGVKSNRQSVSKIMWTSRGENLLRVFILKLFICMREMTFSMKLLSVFLKKEGCWYVSKARSMPTLYSYMYVV